MAGLGPLLRDVSVILDDLRSPEAKSKRLAEFAADKIAEAKALNGQAHEPEIVVDGKKGAPLSSVRPDGVIVANFDLMAEVLSWIGEELRRASPVKSGRYKKSHVLFADGIEVKGDGPVPPADEYVFLNVQPYARKLEGDTDFNRKGSSRQAPDGIYQAVSIVAHGRFGNIAKIEYGYSAFRAGGIENYAGVRKWTAGSMRAGRSADDAARKASLRRKQHTQRRQPAIFVSVNR